MQFFYVWAFLQIVLESLPVSSSGNVDLWLSVLYPWLDLSFCAPISTLEFDFLLHGPTVLIVVLYFFKSWMAFIKRVLKRPYTMPWLLVHCAWADMLTGVWYAIFKGLGKSWFPLSLGFSCTALALLSLRWFCKTPLNKNQSLSLYHATLLGMLQGVALLPGLSRFGITFVAGRYAGYASENAFKYSFLLQMPLICAAFLKGCYSLSSFAYTQQLLHPLFGLTILISTILSYFALVWVGNMIKKEQVYLVGWYVAGLAVMSALLGK